MVFTVLCPVTRIACIYCAGVQQEQDERVGERVYRLVVLGCVRQI